MAKFNWNPFRKKKPVLGSFVERDEKGKWVIREPEVGIIPAEIEALLNEPKVEPKAEVKKAPAKKPVSKSQEKRVAIQKDAADTPVAKPKPKPKAPAKKTTPKKK